MHVPSGLVSAVVCQLNNSESLDYHNYGNHRKVNHCCPFFHSHCPVLALSLAIRHGTRRNFNSRPTSFSSKFLRADSRAVSEAYLPTSLGKTSILACKNKRGVLVTSRFNIHVSSFREYMRLKILSIGSPANTEPNSSTGDPVPVLLQTKSKVGEVLSWICPNG